MIVANGAEPVAQEIGSVSIRSAGRPATVHAVDTKTSCVAARGRCANLNVVWSIVVKMHAVGKCWISAVLRMRSVLDFNAPNQKEPVWFNPIALST